MKERPILMSAPMVRAILAGTKTQTRRAWRDQPPPGVRVGYVPGETQCPYGQPGDRLWVREAWRITGDSPTDTLDMFDRDDVQYRADDDQSYIDKYRPSIHMPRRFSRITLEVTGVRVERLQEISEADAIAEGVTYREFGGAGMWFVGAEAAGTTAVGCYQQLWESINGPESWDANPWVWVVEFKRVLPASDFVGGRK